MTPKEYIKQEYGEPWLKHKWYAGDVMDIVEEYGKYCAEQAWKAKGSMTVYHGDFEDWWSEFQRKEATE